MGLVTFVGFSELPMYGGVELCMFAISNPYYTIGLNSVSICFRSDNIAAFHS